MTGVVQMNVRIDSALKQRGDRILQQQGLTPSQAVRRLWEYVVEHGGVPGFMGGEAADNREAERRRRVALADEGSGMAVRLGFPDPSSRPKGPSVEEIVGDCRNMDEIYDDMLDGMHEMFAQYKAERACHAD